MADRKAKLSTSKVNVKLTSDLGRISFVVGACMLGFVFLVFLISVFYTPYNPNMTDASNILKAPSFEHLFGTDHLGRDVLSRIMSASKYTIFVSFAGIAIALVLGMLMGLTAGYWGGIYDKAIMLLSNSIMCFPGILLALVAVAVFGSSMLNVVFALGIVFSPSFARVLRTGTIAISNREYILHAKILKVNPFRIMVVHILPNLLTALIPAVVIGLANMTLFESAMSFLGLGVQPPAASYGKMLSDAQSYVTTSPWLIVFPAFMLILYILGLYFISEGVRICTSRGGTIE
ncbi:MAG TPA: ABC transporter permease [Saccharofermentans sp.]|nr:ABC transporter permease [Saccharofermentans sp.]HPE27715.1 ABC transporter permease [Saccharofermentans sp.]HPJ81286.1 ABC transporter permease [Saccharofermentans sp.]HPQ32096.1 ABC transporter permease [Saccharofermentans sp.]HRV50696.1 ABC transporter permease [Saccharofermentans sp.]